MEEGLLASAAGGTDGMESCVELVRGLADNLGLHTIANLYQLSERIKTEYYVHFK